MPRDIETYIPGEQLSAAHLEQHRAVSIANRPVPGPGVIETPSGVIHEAGSRAQVILPYRAIFDLYHVRSDKCKVRGFDTESNEISVISAVLTSITGSNSLDTDITLTDDTFIYINVKRTDSGGVATLEITDTYGDGEDDEERFYLWYIPFADDRIVRKGIRDLRGMPRWIAGA